MAFLVSLKNLLQIQAKVSKNPFTNRARKYTTMVVQLRFNPVIKKLKNIIENNDLGNLLSFRAEVCEYMPSFHPYEDYRDLYCSKELGGGVILTQIHELDLIVHLFGTLLMFAYGGKLSSLEIDVEDSVDILMKKDSLSISLGWTIYRIPGEDLALFMASRIGLNMI